jgi:hypothetical protein
VVRELQDYERLISDLAAFLDPLAFERARDRSLEKRRRAALRKAANRLSHHSRNDPFMSAFAR